MKGDWAQLILVGKLKKGRKNQKKQNLSVGDVEIFLNAVQAF